MRERVTDLTRAHTHTVSLSGLELNIFLFNSWGETKSVLLHFIEHVGWEADSFRLNIRILILTKLKLSLSLSLTNPQFHFPSSKSHRILQFLSLLG